MNPDSSIEFIFICCIFLKHKHFANRPAAFAIGPAWNRGFALSCSNGDEGEEVRGFPSEPLRVHEVLRCWRRGSRQQATRATIEQGSAHGVDATPFCALFRLHDRKPPRGHRHVVDADPCRQARADRPSQRQGGIGRMQ